MTAARIADPNSTTGPHIDRWVTECANYLINDAVSEFAVQMPNASDLATQWITNDLEFTAATTPSRPVPEPVKGAQLFSLEIPREIPTF